MREEYIVPNAANITFQEIILKTNFWMVERIFISSDIIVEVVTLKLNSLEYVQNVILLPTHLPKYRKGKLIWGSVFGIEDGNSEETSSSTSHGHIHGNHVFCAFTHIIHYIVNLSWNCMQIFRHTWKHNYSNLTIYMCMCYSSGKSVNRCHLCNSSVI